MKTTNQYKILVIEDNPTQRASLELLLAGAGYNVKTTDSVDQALELVDGGIDCVVAGVLSGDISRMDIIKHWRNFFPDSTLPSVHEAQSAESLVRTITAGAAHDLKPAPDAKLVLTQLMALLNACKKERKVSIPAATALDGVKDGIIGQTPVMRAVFDLIARSSQAFSTVLIQGESGTGKDLVAQAIHRNSPRRAGPFIALNCAAMPETLVESELFGYEKGAFSGAVGSRVGKFEAAGGGTLFIDEIGDCALSLQAKLLRILENRVVTPLGGHREIKVDTRVLAATSRDLPAMVAQGLFREDLFYRLNIISIGVPPLRDRVADIPLLVRFFIERVNAQNHTSPIDSISDAALEALQRYPWPGNVRELLNVIERAMVLADRTKTMIGVGDLGAEIRRGPDTAAHVSPQPVLAAQSVQHAPNDGKEAPLKLAELEQITIQNALAQYGDNKTKAAHAIGISVRTLQRKLARQETPALVILRGE